MLIDGNFCQYKRLQTIDFEKAWKRKLCHARHTEDDHTHMRAFTQRKRPLQRRRIGDTKGSRNTQNRSSFWPQSEGRYAYGLLTTILSVKTTARSSLSALVSLSIQTDGFSEVEFCHAHGRPSETSRESVCHRGQQRALVKTTTTPEKPWPSVGTNASPCETRPLG
jgi:hypothetical protein